MTKQEGPSVCWDAPKTTDPKNDHLFLDCLLCFSWEEEFSMLPSKNKVADEGPSFRQNESSQSSQIYLSPEKLRHTFTFQFCKNLIFE